MRAIVSGEDEYNAEEGREHSQAGTKASWCM